jgi:hypothetical protein
MLERGADRSPPSSAEVKECVELYLHSANTPLWLGTQLKKSTGTSLPLIAFLGMTAFFLNEDHIYNPNLISSSSFKD